MDRQPQRSIAEYDPQTMPTAEKILFVSETPLDDNYPNGVLTTARKTLDYFQQQGRDVRIVCPRTETVDKEYAGYPIKPVGSIVVHEFAIGVGGSNKIPKLMRKFDPDVVLAFSPFGFMSENALTAARYYQKPLVANYMTNVVGYFEDHERSMLERYSTILKPEGKGEYSLTMQGLRKIAHTALRSLRLGHHGRNLAMQRTAMLHGSATINLAPSASAKDELVQLGVNEETIHVWGRGVDLDAHHPKIRDTPEVQDLRKMLKQGRPESQPIGLYVGRVAPEKDLEDLQHLRDLDMQLVIVGDGPSMHDLQRKLGPDVVFAGKQHNPLLARYYAAADIFIHTGQKETFGQTVQEAQATGLPVVAPAVGGPLTTIDHGQTGFLYAPDSMPDLVHSVERLVNSEQLRKKIGAQARASIETKSWDSLGSQLEGHLSRALFASLMLKK